ncbi:hypothetical protein NP233_g12769 [Leucocoprinus birnbaumii]|uniref:Uncharacterized protein n=1 Tax=Leucocoprinus birnbaumii TaxID=56174 RepID=A0AAD5VGB0_9AGAR|nr:hypothetical protein NP233_g12769 [Leucocoprinus birnbaumii]
MKKQLKNQTDEMNVKTEKIVKKSVKMNVKKNDEKNDNEEYREEREEYVYYWDYCATTHGNHNSLEEKGPECLPDYVNTDPCVAEKKKCAQGN